MPWKVICLPESFDGQQYADSEEKAREAGKNRNGLAVKITKDGGYHSHLVGRVLFVRRHSKNKHVTFKTKLQETLVAAAAACDALNNVDDEIAKAKIAAANTKDKIIEALPGDEA